ncbi:hypothetical protein [Streptomyces shenzhenensis]|uniref:hypothetical protein n=1 Tax=Streptomyces shenzhenensis TaxID=943815 RepID=UPI001F3774FE|nr:hypothetical protein [Streptomyces shenzhenensis]
MQRTSDSGAAYGQQPYGRIGYGYAHGHEDTGTPAGTATVEPAPWAAGAPLLPGAPERDSAHGDVIAVPPTHHDASGRPAHEPDAPEPDTPEHDRARPVFVDASGRRQRRVRRVARLLVIPAGAYVALLVSTLLGGPTISAPFVPLPLPDTTHPAAPHKAGTGSSAGTGQPAGGTASGAGDANSLPSAPRAAVGQSVPPTAATTPAATSAATAQPAGTTSATPGPTSAASPTASPTTGATATATATSSAKGRTIAASHKPVK